MVKLMELLRHILSSLAIADVAVPILIRISAMQLPSLDRVAPKYLKPTGPGVTGTWLVGPNSELPASLEAVSRSYHSHTLRPCLESLTPIPWISQSNRFGHVLCDTYRPDGSPDLSAPRTLLRAQLETLRQKHGLELRTAFEYEFYVFKEGTLEPVGSNRLQFSNMRVFDKHQQVFTELKDILEVMGVDLTFLQPEYPAGQWEVTTRPQPGLRGGDVGYYVKQAVKGFFPTKGYHATFMSRPRLEAIASGMHLNHSLWNTCSRQGEDRNVLLDAQSDDKLSDTAKHWIAGLLTHAPALTAICSPTLNCYRRLFNLCAPSLATWGINDRNGVIRARNSLDNVFLENRLVSGAANPYLAIASTVAAGMDGLDRKLTCPPQMDIQAARLPTSLDQALDFLDKDTQLRTSLGDYFLHCYVTAKRDYEVKVFREAKLTTDESRMEFERNLYMEAL